MHAVSASTLLWVFFRGNLQIVNTIISAHTIIRLKATASIIFLQVNFLSFEKFNEA